MRCRPPGGSGRSGSSAGGGSARPRPFCCSASWLQAGVAPLQRCDVFGTYIALKDSGKFAVQQQ